jgi:hypothetical protein
MNAKGNVTDAADLLLTGMFNSCVTNKLTGIVKVFAAMTTVPHPPATPMDFGLVSKIITQKMDRTKY